VLRFASSKDGWNDTLYNDVVVFQEHFLARDIRLTGMGNPHLTLHVEDIEVLSTINESDFDPPPDAVLVLGGKITISEETMKGLCLGQVPPHYPENARTSHMEGPVVMQITIGKDGHVTNAQAISGPDALRKAAIDAIRKWEFRPFLILGEPNEVESKFQIIFSLRN
jgi:TonB family protein